MLFLKIIQRLNSNDDDDDDDDDDRNDADNDLPQEEMLTFYNVMILIKSVLDKNQNHYYCNIFLEKCSYEST